MRTWLSKREEEPLERGGFEAVVSAAGADDEGRGIARGKGF
jgi:hypothetical protein